MNRLIESLLLCEIPIVNSCSEEFSGYTQLEFCHAFYAEQFMDIVLESEPVSIIDDWKFGVATKIELNEDETKEVSFPITVRFPSSALEYVTNKVQEYSKSFGEQDE